MCRTPLIATLALLGCSQASNAPVVFPPQETTSAHASVPAAYAPHRIEAHYLPNAIRVHSKVISGGVPEGDEGFRELASMGVKTVISVDGQKPNVEKAAHFGLRYVHLPHGYDGVPRRRGEELAKAVRELDGPIYVHCHHGKHRSPAGAAVACIAAGFISPAEGVAVLELAGTSRRYRGLFDSVRQAKPLEEALLNEMQVEFRETADVPPMAEAMVKMGQVHENLHEIASAGWRTPADHPDLDPAHEALLLREHFTELLRVEYVQRAPQAFKELVRDSEEAARALEAALRVWQPAASHAEPPEIVLRLSARITANCKACHERFRDVPHSVPTASHHDRGSRRSAVPALHRGS